jgi:hypothetical protein
MRKVEKMKWNQIQKKVKNLKGKTPKSEHCVINAMQRVTAAGKKGVAKTNYKNCGRKKVLTPEETKKVVAFVREGRKKAFCTCRYIRSELKLKVSLATIARTLNNNSYYWRVRAMVAKLTFNFNSDLIYRHVQKAFFLPSLTKATTFFVSSGVKTFLRPQFL